ncbi:hypothetical protein C1H46_031325 [Malus baccata]|uniref:Uncharacterized protein n=1 Tax=Malus baccata TaxID=106549 RepID=A0A540L9D1_MALBA|nr:hypothetical protein C1H46_031325 [Malus baccata]
MYSDQRADQKLDTKSTTPFTSPPPTGMPNPYQGQMLGTRKGDLDLVSTFSVQSLNSSKDVTVAMVWFM